MTVTREVIQDLLPVYFSGEASAATRALVEDFLSRNPEFADQVRREWGATAPLHAPAAGASPDAELRSFRRTRRILSAQRWLFGLAIAGTTLPLSMRISFADGRISDFHFLIREYPWALGPLLGMAVICWVAYFWLRSTVRIER